MKIIDTYSDILTAFDGEEFSLEKWRGYMDSFCPGLSDICEADMMESLGTGRLSFEKDFLPVINAVTKESVRRELAHESFCKAVCRLESRIAAGFGKSPDVNIVFYLGLCSGAGWVTDFNGVTTVLLGIEKIIELDWCGADDMYGLIYHELGHAYQAEYGVLDRSFDSGRQAFLWQLFTEGIAMCFEQELAGDPCFYHQDKNGWKAWCDEHFEDIKRDFDCDLSGMTPGNQRWFGDWVRYRGQGDVGYYLGCRFVREILKESAFDDIIRFDICDVEREYKRFIFG